MCPIAWSICNKSLSDTAFNKNRLSCLPVTSSTVWSSRIILEPVLGELLAFMCARASCLDINLSISISTFPPDAFFAFNLAGITLVLLKISKSPGASNCPSSQNCRCLTVPVLPSRHNNLLALLSGNG